MTNGFYGENSLIGLDFSDKNLPSFDFNKPYPFSTTVGFGQLEDNVGTFFPSSYQAQTSAPSFIPATYGTPAPVRTTPEPSSSTSWAEGLTALGGLAGIVGDTVRAFRGEPPVYSRLAGSRMSGYFNDPRNAFSQERGRLQQDVIRSLEERIRELERAQEMQPSAIKVESDIPSVPDVTKEASAARSFDKSTLGDLDFGRNMSAGLGTDLGMYRLSLD
jgi:hypothetical protein